MASAAGVPIARSRSMTAGVACAWWVRLRPIIVSGTPLAKTISAASGSTKALNSAYGRVLPRPVEPPIQTISLTAPGVRSSSAAMLVSGPVATTVAGPCAAISSSAPRSSRAMAGSGSSAPSSPLSP